VWPTLKELRRLQTGDVLHLDRHGACRFLRLQERRAVFVQVGDGKRVNLWFVDLLTPPPAPAASVRETDTPPADETGARTDP
jgi:hypothetical protein